MNTATLAETHPHASSRALPVALWITQLLLFVGFGMAGLMHTTKPIAGLAAVVPWTGRLPPELVRFIGLAELAGALGILLPSLSRIKPSLTPLAGIGLTTVMVLAAAHHLAHGEAAIAPVNGVLGGLAAFVAWGRFRKAPIAAR